MRFDFFTHQNIQERNKLSIPSPSSTDSLLERFYYCCLSSRGLGKRRRRAAGCWFVAERKLNSYRRNRHGWRYQPLRRQRTKNERDCLCITTSFPTQFLSSAQIGQSYSPKNGRHVHSDKLQIFPSQQRRSELLCFKGRKCLSLRAVQSATVLPYAESFSQWRFTINSFFPKSFTTC